MFGAKKQKVSGKQSLIGSGAKLNGDLVFDGDYRAHDVAGNKRDFYYEIPMRKDCINCHTNWKEYESTGYLKVSLDPNIGKNQKENLIFGIFIVLAIVNFPTVRNN